jgi:uncharacterized protein YdaU (DUF1376 family)
MTDIPAMLLWTDAYMADTSHLTTTEHGAYLLILMAMWRAGGTLPNDEIRIARVARLSLDKWRKIAPSIMEFMSDDGKAITQKRLKLEFEIASSKAQKLADAGRAGGRAKALKKLKPTPSDANSDANGTPQAIGCQKPSESLPNQIPDTNNQLRESSLSETASPPQTTSKPSDEFLSFWKAYPTTPIMSRKEALAAWGKLSPEDRKSATEAVEPYRAYCRTNPTYSTVHACRFLSQRRFEGFQQQAPALALVSSSFYAPAGSKQLEAWQDHKRQTTGKSCPVDAKGGWTFPSEYPPSSREDAA